jgi:MFS family permease
MWFTIEEAPAPSLRPLSAEAGATPSPGSAAVWQDIAVTLSNPALWLVAVSLCLLDACRYGFTDWGVTRLKEVQGASVSGAAFKYAVLPFGGIAGAYLAGWATERWFGGRRAPVICVLLVMLGLLAVAYNTVIHWGMAASVTVLFLIGFCIFGPQVLLVGTLPADLARRGTAAAVAGFVNFMGYMGAAAGDKFTGQLAQNHGWHFVVWFWAACAFAGADIAQIDDPHLCLFVDPAVRATYSDPDAVAGFAVDMVNAVVDGVKGIKLAVHLRRRVGGRARGEVAREGGYGPILAHLNRLKVHHLTM